MPQCPNCRNNVPFLRTIRVTAWSSLQCQSCGSILGVSLNRRLLAGGLWLFLLVVSVEMLHLPIYTHGRPLSYALMIISLIVAFYLLEKLTLLDRRAFTCTNCGYDLRGLQETRCPECATPFDPDERRLLLERANMPHPKPRNRIVVATVIVFLILSTTAGLLAYRYSARKATTPKPPIPAPIPPATNTNTNAL